ncbi:MAG: helix-turn-helix transcriptional regulator [Planctomycetes bacterium]|nr:helix-turn-helix transcriptional regulator [Planctomycetota bacterium]
MRSRNSRAVGGLRQAIPSDGVLRDLADVFSVLGHESRLKIVAALSRQEATVNDLAAAVDMTVSALSHQLSKLRDLRIVRTRREGRSVWYAIDDQHVADLLARGIEHLSHP